MQKLTLACFGIAGCVWLNVTTAAEKERGGLEVYLQQQTEKEQAAQSAAKKRKAEDARTERICRQRAENARQQELVRQQQIEQERIARERAAEAARQEKEAEARRKAEWEAKLGMQMVSIPAGGFTMGCQSGRDKDCYGDESPSHSVSLSAFELGKYEVTQGQWKAVMGSNPSYFKDCGDTCPVENVSWDDAQEFIRKLNDKTGNHYRLPSEAEWEYACRAGQSSNYCGGDNADSVAWYSSNSGDKTHPVGGKQKNAWGLYDMSGNVWEWVQDGYHSNYDGAPKDGEVWSGATERRVLRGGSWDSIARNSRAANRIDGPPAIRILYVGFRLARTPQ